MNDESILETGLKTCAICGKPQLKKYKPFCSSRCADIDLHRWFSGTYAVPSVEGEDGDEINNSEDV